MEISFFNVDDGFAEGLVRGLRSGFLTNEDYKRLAMADTLEDLRSALEETEYGNFLQDEPLPLNTHTINRKCRMKLAQEFNYLRCQASRSLSKFLDFIAIEKMIDNVVMVIQGASRHKNHDELLARLDPMGYIQELTAIGSFEGFGGESRYEEMYKVIFVDTPVGPYFQKYLDSHLGMTHRCGDDINQNESSGSGGGRSMHDVASIVTEADIELLRNCMKKAWLEDFYRYVQNLSPTTKEVMSDILKTEADFRVLTLLMNSINVGRSDRNGGKERSSSDLFFDSSIDKLTILPNFGYLYPDGTDRIRKAWNDQTIRAALEPFPKYVNFYEQCKGFYVREGEMTEAGVDAQTTEVSSTRFKSLEDLLYHETVKMCEMTFEQQFHYGIFYAWVKLKEQEIRNIVWIADMILMKRKEHIDSIVPLFAARF